MIILVKIQMWQLSIKALTYILLSLTLNVVRKIQTCTKPKQAWDKLKNCNEQNTRYSWVALKKKYFRKDLKDVEQHLNEMADLADWLGMMGAEISDDDQIDILLVSLPISYKPLNTTLCNQLNLTKGCNRNTPFYA